MAFDARLTDAESGVVVHLFPCAESMSNDVDVEEYSWRLLEAGTVKAPRGANPKTHSYSSFFPDAGDVGEPWCPDDWRPPLDLGYQLNRWLQLGARLRLTVTETSVDAIVYLASIRETWGELGRLRYELSLVELVEMTVTTVTAQEATADDAAATETGGTFTETLLIGGGAIPPSAPAPPGSIVVKAGQDLPILAKLYLGDSARWTEIRDANATTLTRLGLVGTALRHLPAGLVLVIPGGVQAQQGELVGTTR